MVIPQPIGGSKHSIGCWTAYVHGSDASNHPWRSGTWQTVVWGSWTDCWPHHQHLPTVQNTLRGRPLSSGTRDKRDKLHDTELDIWTRYTREEAPYRLFTWCKQRLLEFNVIVKQSASVFITSFNSKGQILLICKLGDWICSTYLANLNRARSGGWLFLSFSQRSLLHPAAWNI